MGKMKFIISVIASFAFFVTAGQDRCGTNMDLVWMQTNAPNRYQRFIDLENFTSNYINNQGQNSSRLINGNGVIIIPVVVHVLHRGEAEGSGNNISMAQIQSQIDVLNEDYRRLNADAINTPSTFMPVASDFGIEFRLACIDPNGDPTNGVVRKYTNTNPFIFAGKVRSDGTTDEDAIGIKRAANGSAAWPTDRYLNIWVCNMDVLGYSSKPADYSTYPQDDGIVILNTAFGRTGSATPPYHKGRTATHEIGHWLNLFHIWGDQSENFNCLRDDLVDDTPKQKLPSNGGCPTYPDLLRRCNTNDPSTMFMNYMDVTDDICMNIFTNGQKLRTRAIFAVGGPREQQLNNWFKVRQSKTPITCSGIVYSSPACLSSSWTVLSGPATITSGPGSNQATLQATGVGNVLIRATSGNYITEDNISVTNVAPSAQGYYYITSNYHTCPGCQNGLGPNNSHFLPAGQQACFDAHISNTQDITNIQWSNSGYPVFYTVGNGGSSVSFCMTAAQGAYNTVTTTFTLTAQTSCGTITQSFNFSIVTQGWGYRVAISPNPAKDILHISEKIEKVKKINLDKNVTMELIQLNTGRKVKQWKFTTMHNEFDLDIRGILSGQYILIVRRGKEQDIKQISIE